MRVVVAIAMVCDSGCSIRPLEAGMRNRYLVLLDLPLLALAALGAFLLRSTGSLPRMPSSSRISSRRSW